MKSVTPRIWNLVAALLLLSGAAQAQEELVLPQNLASISITRAESGVAPGNVFIATFDAPPHTAVHRLVINESDEVMYYRQMSNNSNPYFVPDTMGNRIVWYDASSHKFQLLDTSFTILDYLDAGDFPADHHDLQLLPNGNYLVIGSHRKVMNLSGVVDGGQVEALVVGMAVLEIDRVTGDPVFEWLSLDHQDELPLTDSYEDLTTEYVDYLHPNSVELDGDDGYIVSLRHTSSVIKIDKQTGSIVWKLGGKDNSFQYINEDRDFRMQHYARRLDNGNLLIFDNGSDSDPLFARAVEYELNELEMTATKVWEFDHNKEVISYSRGNASRLPNGNTMIGWGQVPLGQPSATEVTPAGEIVWEITMGPCPTNGKPIITYQVHRAPIDIFMEAPRLSWEILDSDDIRLLFAKFGDDEVTGYEVYTGPGPESLEYYATTSSTSLIVDKLDAQYPFQYFSVVALYGNDSKSDPSNLIWIDTGVLDVGEEQDANLPDSWCTLKAWPNPFNESAHVNLNLREQSSLRVEVIDLLGRHVALLHDGRVAQGEHTWTFDGSHLASGIYLLRATASDGRSAVRRMTLLR